METCQDPLLEDVHTDKDQMTLGNHVMSGRTCHKDTGFNSLGDDGIEDANDRAEAAM